jgi:hypothetical protein
LADGRGPDGAYPMPPIATEIAEPANPAAAGRARRRAIAPLVVVVVLLQLLAVGGLVSGSRILFLRDVLTIHLPMKLAQVAAWQQGEIPLLDLQRGGGQPSLGNPNAVPLHPDNLLYLVLPFRVAFAAHFWLSFLLAPWSAAWLARRLGCGAAAAWAGGVVYALSGFFLSQLSFYNLAAGAAAAPAFVAACLAARDGSRRAGAAAGALWALLLVSGDPTLAALALAAAGLAVTLAPARAANGAAAATAADAPSWTAVGRKLPRLALPLALGTALALPQLVEMSRVLESSTRAVRGFDQQERTLGSWDPRQALEQIVPLAFGRLDRAGPGGFWGHRFHTGAVPFYLTLYPGLLAFGLAAAAGRGRGLGGGVAWALVGAGVFFALGRFNPLLGAVSSLPGAGLLRFPVKAWLLVALGLSVLAAAGWQRAFGDGDPRARRRWRVTLLALAASLAMAAVVLPWCAAGIERGLGGVLPPAVLPEVVAGTPSRWAATCAATALAAVGLLLAGRLARSRPAVGGALALALHAGCQLALLAPAALATDSAERYPAGHPFAAWLPPGSRIVHGSLERVFGAPALRIPGDRDVRWFVRQGHAAGYPLVGAGLGWRYELARSPEGLDSFLTRLASDSIRMLPDAARLRLLQVWGVEALILERPLDAGAPVDEVASVGGPLGTARLYRLRDPLPEVRRVHGARWAADPRGALRGLLDPAFDPRQQVVLGGVGEDTPGGAGAARAVSRADGELVVETSGTRSGWLVVERTWQPQWRAEVDGRPVRLETANLHRLAVPVGPGRQRVRLYLDWTPVRRAAWAAALGAFGLLALAVAGRRPG